MRPWPPPANMVLEARRDGTIKQAGAGHRERVVVVPCDCDPRRNHGPHYRPVRRVEVKP